MRSWELSDIMSSSAENSNGNGIVRLGNSVEDVVIVLRERIISGYYAPGTRMSQHALAKEMSVSRTPLREALNRLESEGLVVSQANRGMTVAPADPADAEDAYAVRLLVEPPIIGELAPGVSKEDLRRMAEALARMELPGISSEEYQTAHMAFHRVLLDRYPRAVRELTEWLYMRIIRHQRIYFDHPVAFDGFNHVDREFLNALRSGDGELARQLLEFHLVDAAMGAVLDIDPGHTLSELAVSVQSVGMHVDGLSKSPVSRPSSITWRRAAAVPVPTIKTQNLTTH